MPFHEQAFSSEQLEENAQQREKEGLLTRMFDAMGSASFGGVDVGDVASAQRDRYDLVMQNTATVAAVGPHGGVIVGRNGAFILADWPGALHVMLDGPLEQRIARAAQEAGISLERAARRQKNEDRVRADMSIKLYGWDPRDPTRYDLVVNTGRMDLDTCVEIIVDACADQDGPPRSAEPIADPSRSTAWPRPASSSRPWRTRRGRTCRSSRILGYAAGDAGCNIAFQMTGLFLLVFYTDVVGIDPIHAGNIFLFVKIWDAFADLFAGRMVDRTMTRWGKFRPFLLWYSVPLLAVEPAVLLDPGRRLRREARLGRRSPTRCWACSTRWSTSRTARSPAR